jgi:hypothetical protein
MAFALSLERRVKLTWFIDRHLQNNTMTPGEASKMRGRLNWSCSSLFGRIGRAKVTPFTHRAAKPGRWPQLNQFIVGALRWWKDLLRDTRADLCAEVRLTDRLAKTLPTPLVYTDSSLKGTGVFVVIPESIHGPACYKQFADVIPQETFHELETAIRLDLAAKNDLHLLDDTSVRDIAIAVLETAVVLLVFTEFHQMVNAFAGTMADWRRGIAWVDNNTTLSTVIRGNARGKVLGGVLTLMSDKIWHQLAIKSLCYLFLRVGTHQNPADLPSRNENAEKVIGRPVPYFRFRGRTSASVLRELLAEMSCGTSGRVSTPGQG